MVINGDIPVLLNRELSVLKFNERVLSMAERADVPLLERLRYLCIVGSNLDEFFEIRIASLKEQQLQSPDLVGVDGMTADQAFDRVQRAVHALVDKQNRLLIGEVMPKLMEQGVGLVYSTSWNDTQKQWAHAIFHEQVMPLLTPIGLDPAHPFPRVYNKSLNFIVPLTGQDAFERESNIAIVQAPRALPRMLKMPADVAGISDGFMLLTTLINAFVGELFPGMDVQGCYQWRVTRNSDLYVDEEEITNLRQALQGELSQRNFGAAVRLEIAHAMPQELEIFLQKEFNLGVVDTYRVNGPVNLTRLMQICDQVKRPELEYPSHKPQIPDDFATGIDKPADFFAKLTASDHLLHHPYQSFQPVLMFLRSASLDPQVVAIKQTIYRTGEDSELMGILLSAAKSGKEVTVVVELMARFDEQTNINWAARLEEVGAHVSYGVVGHKTHAKMALVLRKENGRIKRYGHLSTGNYHQRTATLYTDFGLLTANQTICADMDQVFSLLTGLGARRELNLLLQSPFTLHTTIIDLIKQETEFARSGKRAHIRAKMNSLLEPTVIQALYEASQAGVRIDLLVRGACALQAGVPNLSSNIRVRSIIGRFLEHSRVFYFYHSGAEKLFLSSADWMDRNFFRRVELAFPVLDKKLRRRVIDEAFTFAWRDNQLAWSLQSDSRYLRVRNRRLAMNLHQHLMAKFQ